MTAERVFLERIRALLQSGRPGLAVDALDQRLTLITKPNATTGAIRSRETNNG